MISLYKGEIKPLETKCNLHCSVSTISHAVLTHDCTISIPVPSQAVFPKNRSTRNSLRVLREIVKQKHNHLKIPKQIPNIPRNITVISVWQLPVLEQSTNCFYCCLVSKRFYTYDFLWIWKIILGVLPWKKVWGTVTRQAYLVCAHSV